MTKLSHTTVQVHSKTLSYIAHTISIATSPLTLLCYYATNSLLCNRHCYVTMEMLQTHCHPTASVTLLWKQHKLIATHCHVTMEMLQTRYGILVCHNIMNQHTVRPDYSLYKVKDLFCRYLCILITKDFTVLKICSLLLEVCSLSFEL
jgi:hypothetical protein